MAASGLLELPAIPWLLLVHPPRLPKEPHKSRKHYLNVDLVYVFAPALERIRFNVQVACPLERMAR